jgi:hypothetical protein
LPGHPAGPLLLLGVPLYLAYTGMIGTFRWALLWLLAVPVVMAIIGSAIVGYSWSLAYRKRFHCDGGYVPLEVGFLDWYERWLDNALAGGDGAWWMNESLE